MNMLKKTLIYILSLMFISLIYQGTGFFLLPISALIVPSILIVTYQKYLFRNICIGNVYSLIVTLLTVAFGCLVHHIGWVYSTGDMNNFLHPDAESAAFGKTFSFLNVTGALVVNIAFIFIKTMQRRAEISTDKQKK